MPRLGERESPWIAVGYEVPHLERTALTGKISVLVPGSDPVVSAGWGQIREEVCPPLATRLPIPDAVCVARVLIRKACKEPRYTAGREGPGERRMRKAAGAVAAAFAMGTGAMTLMGMAFAVHVEAAVLGVVGLALYASSSLLSGKASTETADGVAKQA